VRDDYRIGKVCYNIRGREEGDNYGGSRMTVLDSAMEGSTYVAVISFKDEAGVAMVPTSATWTLLDEDDAVINSRSDVAISGIASSVNIVLSGIDLPYIKDQSRVYLVVESVYTGAYGTGLPLKDYFEIGIIPIPGE
jgi:hypothetical protein